MDMQRLTIYRFLFGRKLFWLLGIRLFKLHAHSSQYFLNIFIIHQALICSIFYLQRLYIR